MLTPVENSINFGEKNTEGISQQCSKHLIKVYLCLEFQMKLKNPSLFWNDSHQNQSKQQNFLVVKI